MTKCRIDFYLSLDPDPKAQMLIACRLLEKAYLRGHRVFVLCDSLAFAENLDELLWTFKELSFIPHHLQGEGPEPPPPIQIGTEKPHGFRDILLNLCATIPPFFSQFRRIMEIIAADEPAIEIGRDHYREYRANGCELHTHEIESALAP
ncbi:MAG: DNA polymerase III subunit chi [Legionellales bacterium]|nr:DNA polymerase III subunit chi [Legionellales bacterium]